MACKQPCLGKIVSQGLGHTVAKALATKWPWLGCLSVQCLVLACLLLGLLLVMVLLLVLELLLLLLECHYST